MSGNYNSLPTKRKLDQKIMEILDEDSANEEYLLDKIRESTDLKFDESKIHSALLRVFTSLDFTETEAEIVWQEIINYKIELTKQLKRDVGFRVAMLDYFININKKLVNPKIIEIKLYAETEKLVLIDELTKLYNRRHFQNSIQREFKQAQRYNQPLSVVIFDIDNFKKINDTYGHPKGDEILINVARAINSCMREEDTACRIGGEEFAVILPQTNEGNALTASQKVIEACRSIKIDGKSVTLSGGVASFPEKAKTMDAIFDFADKALYYAKYSGKDKVVAYSHDKRGSLRVSANLALQFQMPDKTIKTISKNISITGIAFETEDEIELNDSFEVKLIDDQSSKEIEARIKIVRKEKSTDNKFQIGAEFTELFGSSKQTLNELSERNSKERSKQ